MRADITTNDRLLQNRER